jgi:hypothetical protein
VHRDDVRVIQRRYGLYLALESMTRVFAFERALQELHRDGTIQPRVGGAVDLAHATGAESGLDPERANERPRAKRHGERADYTSASSIVSDWFQAYSLASFFGW